MYSIFIRFIAEYLIFLLFFGLTYFFIKKEYLQIHAEKNFHYINAETGEVDGVKTFNPEDPIPQNPW